MRGSHSLSISFSIHSSLLKPRDSELTEMPPLRRSHGLSGSRLFIHTEGIAFQNCFPNPGEMTLLNCVNIRFLTILAIGQAAIPIICGSNENTKLIVPWDFSLSYQLSRHGLNYWTPFRAYACSGVSGFWLAAWLWLSGCSQWKSELGQNHWMAELEGGTLLLQANSRLLPRTQLRLRKVTRLPKDTAWGRRAKAGVLVQGVCTEPLSMQT